MVQAMETDSVEEIEDFGISNLPDLLNKFQLGKRERKAVARALTTGNRFGKRRSPDQIDGQRMLVISRQQAFRIVSPPGARASTSLRTNPRASFMWVKVQMSASAS